MSHYVCSMKPNDCDTLSKKTLVLHGADGNLDVKNPNL